MLVKTSRSFALVIQELGDELRVAVCIFYLVLRALDTIGNCTTSLHFLPHQLFTCYFSLI